MKKNALLFLLIIVVSGLMSCSNIEKPAEKTIKTNEEPNQKQNKTKIITLLFKMVILFFKSHYQDKEKQFSWLQNQIIRIVD